MSKDNTPDELDGIDKLFKKFIQYSSGYNEYTIEEEKMPQFEEELRDYIASEIDEIIGKDKNSPDPRTTVGLCDYITVEKGRLEYIENRLRAEQRETLSDRGWRIG